MKPANQSKYLEEFLTEGKLKSIRVIDCHTHMDDVAGCALPVSDIDGCVRLMQEENVESFWCAPHGDVFSPTGNNREIKEYMAKYPGVVRGYYSFHPYYREEYEKGLSEILSNEGYIGLKFLPEYHHTKLESEAYAGALAFADEHRLAVLIHTWGGSAFNGPGNVEQVAKKYPRAQILMGHSAPGALDDAIRLAKEHENVYLDICDIHRNNGTIARMCREAGSEKVVFGTDLPWYDPNYAIGSVLGADICDEERENIFRRTAEKILSRIER